MDFMKTPHISHDDGNRLAMLETLPKHGVCAELGVLKGDFSEEILKRCHPKRLYLVDLFKGNVSSGDQDGKNWVHVDMGNMRWVLETRFVNTPTTIVASDSITWLLAQPRGSLSWVYIDTSHDFEQTAGELIAARDAVMDGGFICGHDYDKAFPGVIKATENFCSYYGLKLELWEGDAITSYKIKNNLHVS